VARDENRRSTRFPTAVVATGALGLLVVIGAAYGGQLRFGAPRFDFTLAQPTTSPVTATSTPIPTATAKITPKPTAHVSAMPDLVVLAIIVGSLAAVIALLFALRWWMRRTRDVAEGVIAPLDDVALEGAAPAYPDLETSQPVIRRGLLRALDLLGQNRIPTDAIVVAWLGLQEAAEDAGFSRASSETPTEFTTRILLAVHVDSEALDVLRRLYLAVRFGDAVATSHDVDRARAALETLAAGWVPDAETVGPASSSPTGSS